MILKKIDEDLVVVPNLIYRFNYYNIKDKTNSMLKIGVFKLQYNINLL
jgi:hypothetical protein